MNQDKWTVVFSGQAKKYKKTLPSKPELIFRTLVEEFEFFGPHRRNWKNYDILKGKKHKGKEIHHCHLNKGHPTYVVCWIIEDKKIKIIEVFYAGTHENAPY